MALQGSDDSWRRLGWEVEFEALQQEAVIVFRFGVARKHDGAPVGRRQFDVDHLDPPSFSMTTLGVRPGASACSRRLSVTIKQ